MSIKLKALGLGIAAALAISGTTSLSAPAETGGHFILEAEHALVEGTENPTHKTRFSFPQKSTEVECEETAYTGTTAGVTVTAITFAPSYKKCRTPAGKIADVTMNECHYLLTIRKTEPDKKHSTVHLVCPAGKKMSIHITEGVKCTFEFGSQTVLGGAVYTTVGSGKSHELTVDVTFENVNYTSTDQCALFGGEGPYSDGGLFGSFTLKVKVTTGEQIGITAT